MPEPQPDRRQRLADDLDRVHSGTIHPHGSRAAWLAVADRVIAIERAAHTRGKNGQPQ
jgi:hypothetical protein